MAARLLKRGGRARSRKASRLLSATHCRRKELRRTLCDHLFELAQTFVRFTQLSCAQGGER